MPLTPPPPVPIYDSARRPPPVVAELRDLLTYRDLLTQLIARNIKTRYKRSLLGVAWTMLNPLLTMAVMALVFSSLFVSTVPYYPVYILAGLVGWTFYAQTTSAIMSELVWGGSLLSRIYVPRATFALAALGTGLINLLLSLLPLALLMLLAGAPLTPALLILPLPILLLALFTLGVGLVLSTLALQFADVVDMYQIVLTAWMYLTPIIYPLDIVPAEYRWLIALNPLVPLLDSFRLPIQRGQLPEAGTLLSASLLAGLTAVGGWWFFAQRADEIAYRV